MDTTIIDNRILKSITIGIMLVLLFATVACVKSTSPTSIKFSGKVLLHNDTQDSQYDVNTYEDITVAIYKTVNPDTTWARLNREFPHIGVKATQDIIFDHRFFTPEAVVKTNEYGNFEFPNLREGRYNLFAFKENWGGQYMLDIGIAKNADEEYQLENIITLYPEISMPFFAETDFEFLSSHVYRFEHDTVIFSNISVNPKAILLIDPGVKVNFVDSAITVTGDDYWKITSSNSFYSTETNENILPFSYVKFSGSTLNSSLKNLIFDFSTDGLSIQTDQFKIENSVFKYNTSYALNVLCNKGVIANCVFWKNPMYGAEVKNNILIGNSLFIDNKDACRVFECGGLVQNNYFSNNWLGLRPFLSDIEIMNNNFDNNYVAIPLCAADPAIMLNNFYNNKIDVELNNYYVHQSIAYCNPKVQRNNFFDSEIYVKFKGTNSLYGSTPPGVNRDQHYPQNYWKDSDPYNRIMDGNYPEADFTFVLDIFPKSTRKVNGAGIN